MPMHWPPSVASTPSIYSEVSDPRLRVHRPFSSFFSGTSTVSSRSDSTRQSVPKPSDDGPPRLPRLNLSPMSTAAPTLRSPSSTRSIIDPASSPITSARRISAISFRENPLLLDFIAPPQARVLDYGGNMPVNLEDRVQRNTSGASRTSRARDHLRQRGRRPRWIPKRSRGKVWFPAMENTAVRTKVFHCIVSGSLLAMILITFIALSTQSSAVGQELRIIVVLFILVFAVLFFHSLIRLFMLNREFKRGGPAVPLSRVGTEGFADISSPIRVVLARDEELGISGTQAVDPEKGMTPPPPAYGLWRGSVRVDPNLLHWQRVERPANGMRPLSEVSQITIHRPPSYAGADKQHRHEHEQQHEQQHEGEYHEENRGGGEHGV